MLQTLFVVTVLVMAMMLIRAVKGPGLFNRLLAINVFGTLTVLLLVLFSVWFDQPNLIDIALLYALINFIGPLVILRFFEGHELPEEQVRMDDFHD